MVATNKGSDPMEIFTLAAISRGGLTTLYSMQREAGLQPGGLLPVIRRLEEEGLLTRLEEAKRRRRVMKVTAKGKDFLAANWKSCLDEHRELESILRSATVALLMGDSLTARTFLYGTAVGRERRVGITALTVSSSETAPIEFFADMREVYENRRRAAEAALLYEFVNFLEKVDEKRN